MNRLLIFAAILSLLTACASQPTGTPLADMPNPASVYCEAQGNRLEIRTAADGSQSGACIFPDGSECDEWAYYRGECGPAVAASTPQIPTALPIDPSFYEGWWTYTHPVYGFSILLPEDWSVGETTTGDPLMSGHELNLYPRLAGTENIRMTFRRSGEDTPLWPSGVGEGAFVPQGTLDVSGEAALRLLLVCPAGEVTSIWYHGAEGQPNITRGGLEFGFIFSAGEHCKSGLSLGGKVQRVGEMVIASLSVP